MEFVPRGPLVLNEKSGTLDYPDGYQTRMLRWREAAKQEALRTVRMNPEYEKIAQYISALEGNYWDPRRPRYRSRFFDNRLMDARLQELSILTDIRPTISVSSRHPDPRYRKQAEIANAIIRSEWFRNDLDLKLVEAIDHALFATGFWKIAAGSPGYITVIPCGIDSVMPIQMGQDLQESTAVLYRAWKPLSYFLDRWGHLKDELIRRAARVHYDAMETEQRPSHIPQYTWSTLSPGFRRLLSSRSSSPAAPVASPFPLLEIEEYWIDDPNVNETEQPVLVKDPYLDLESHNYHYTVHPGGRLFPRKRLVVFTGDLILYDGPSPYWHGMFPFAELTLNPAVWCPLGLSKYRDLMPIAQAINEIVAGVLDAIKKAINPQLVARESAVREQAWTKFLPDMPGAKLRLTSIADPHRDLRYMDPPVIPAYVVQMLLSYLIPGFDRHSGAIDVAQLGKKRQVPGGETIEQMRDAQQTKFRLEGRRVEAFLRRAGLMAVSHIFQFYTVRQRMRYLGADGITMEDFDYDPGTMVPDSVPKEDHWKMFSVDIAQGSSHGASTERAKQIALLLYRLGAISRRELLRRMDYQNIDEIVQEIMEERAIGMGPPVPGRVPRTTRAERTAKM